MSIFEKGALREAEFEYDGIKFRLRELRLSERREILEASRADHPIEVVSALTVAMSCPDLSEKDIERLVDEVRPEILVAAASKAYELSGMVEGSRNELKKPSGSLSAGSPFAWLWRWAVPSRS